MPELPEVETLRRELEPHLCGRRLEAVSVRRRDLRFPLPRDFAACAQGLRLETLARRGKYLLFHFEGDLSLLCHLGMSGQIFTTAPPQAGTPRHEHLAFRFSGGRRLRFIDPRRFGFWDRAKTSALGEHPRLCHLGIEPLGDAPKLDGAALALALGGRRCEIKRALLDQHILAGVGNIYASEALFRAGISPFRAANTIRARRAERLADALRAVLEEAIEAGGSSSRDYRRSNEALGYFQHSWGVYGRAGAACPTCTCKPETTGGVRAAVQGGRSTFYCPRKQR